MGGPKRVAIILFQLGGPDSQAAVEPFLYNLFCDPDIINFPGAFLARKALAKLISTRRSKVVGAALCRNWRRLADPHILPSNKDGLSKRLFVLT